MSKSFSALSSAWLSGLFFLWLPALALAGVSGPSSSSTGKFTLTLTGTPEYLTEYKNGSRVRDIAVSGSSASITVSSTGTYRYDAWSRLCLIWGFGGRCEEWDIEKISLGSHTVKVTLEPNATPPGSISLPSTSTSGNIRVQWGAASVKPKSYELWRKIEGSTTWKMVYSGSALYKDFSDLITGKYEFRARACISGCSSYTSSKSITVVRTPHSIGVPVTNLYGSIAVSWSSVYAAEKYILQEQKDGGAWTQVYNGIGTSNTLTGRSTGSYLYRVAAIKGGITGAFKYSTTVTVVRSPLSISVPVASANGILAISWAAVSGADKYLLQEQKNGGSWTQVYSGSGTQKTLTGRGSGSYSYRVAAVKGSTTGLYKQSSTVTVISIPQSITVPASSTTGSVTVSWSQVAGADKYVLQEQKNNGSWTQVYSGSGTQTTLSGRGSDSYIYRVAAVKGSVTTAFKSSSTVIVSRPPAVPGNLTLPGSSTGAYSVSWSPVTGAARYILAQSGNASGSWSLAGTSKPFSQSSNGNYSYRVRACKTYGGVEACSGWSSSKTVAVSLPVLAIQSINGGSVKLSWNIDAQAQRITLKRGSTTIYDSGWKESVSKQGTFTDSISTSGSYSYFLTTWYCSVGIPGGGCQEGEPLNNFGPETANIILKPGPSSLLASVSSSYDGSVGLTSNSSGPIESVRWQKRKAESDWPADSSYGSAGSSTFSVTGLTDGNWEFRSKNCNSSGCSNSWSTSVGLLVRNQPIPTAPTLDTITNSSTGTLKLNWSDRSAQQVYRYKLYEGGKLLEELTTSSANPAPLSGTTLQRDDGSYSYYLIACNLRACSTASNVQSVIVAKTPGAPKSPNLSTTFSRTGEVDLTWGSASGTIVHYEIIAGTASSAEGPVSWDENAPSKHTDLTRLSKKLSLENGFFAYQVRACNQVSSFSSCSNTVATDIVQVDQTPPPVIVAVPPYKASALSTTDPSVLASDRVGILPGEFRVSESGAATYTIPLQVGPSSGGSTPALSVTYSSSGSNGPLGAGWGISGLSAISACRRTFEEDGANGSVFDRFCLDGQRLKLVSGQYGSLGSEYRTSLDSFVQVRLVSSPVGSGQGFEVYRKDGSISYYGMHEDAQQEKTWYLNTQEDSVGNRIEYTYLKDTALGEHLIEAVDYSANGHDATLNRIQFHYDTSRSDKRYGYSFGQKTASTRRLTAITSTADSMELRSYNFSYQESATGRLLLEEVEECVQGNCRKPTIFTYAQFAGAGMVSAAANPNIFHSGYEGGKYGDVNGDGLTDLVFIRYDGSHGKRYLRVALGTAEGELALQSEQMRIRANERKEWHLLDYNNDGKDDLLHAPIDDTGTHWAVNLSNGSGFSSTDNPTAISYQKDQLGQMHDFNADGLPDFLSFTHAVGLPSVSDTPTMKIRELQRSSSGTLSFKSSETTRSLSLPTVSAPGGVSSANFLRTTRVKLRNTDMVADFNGDGIADLTAIMQTDWTCIEAPSDCNNQSHVTDNHFVVLMSEGDNSHRAVFHRALNGEIAQVDDAEHRIADLNGDSLPDMLFRPSADWDWGVYYFTGEGFISTGTLPGAVDDKIQLYDWDMDGLVDILYPNANDKENNEYQYLYVLPNHSNGFGSAIDTSLLFGADTNDHSHLVMDLTGDGRPEIVENCANRDEQENHCDDMRNHSGFFSGLGATDKYVRVFKPKHADKPVDVLESVVNGFGVKTEIRYARLNDTSTSVYSRKLGSFKLNYGRSSPVFDLYSPMYVVQKVISDAPAANDNNNTVEAHYHYAGGRMQSGGRGFLGFESVTTYDPQNQVKTTTHYRQDYPFIGMPSQTAKVIESNASNIKTPATCEGSGLTLISCSINTLESIAPVSGKTVMPYISQAEDKSYSLSGSYLGKVVTTTNYTAANDIQYGNVSSVTVKHYDASNNLVQSKSTSNTYDNVVSSDRWHLARLRESSVTTQRYGALVAPQITRTAHFDYDNQTGLLTDEWVAKGSAQELHTHYEHDRFGNRVASTVTNAQGESRTSRTGFDGYGRYALNRVNELKQTAEQALEMDPFGQPQRVLDISGVETHYAYSPFGNRYFEHHETGSHATTLSTLCADSGGCPTIAGVPAHFKVTTAGIDQSQSVMYHDRLGREIRKQTQDFHGNPVFVDTQYDEQSRVKKVSDPYGSGGSPRWTIYSYDILGRTTNVDTPSGQCDSTITYNGLTETATNCAQQSKVTEKNALGELAQVTDNIGGKLQYSYYADGNLKQVRTLNSGGGETSATNIEYDNLGRKTRMVDPDKGTWTYGYTGFGELAWQKDAKGQGTAMSYDALGRMVTRADYTSFDSNSQTGTLQNFSRWYYDQDPGCDSKFRFEGKLVAVAQAPVAIAAGCNANLEDVNYLKLLQYDTYGRLGETNTGLGVLDGDGDFYEKVTYDQYSRVSRSFDASNQQVGDNGDYLRGVETVYNNYGFKVGVRDVTAPADSGYYYRVKRMNLRGQVEEVLLGNGLTTTYAYDPQHHRLTSILTDINPGVGQVQNLHYDWNTIGNLLSKTDLSGDGSYRKDLQERFEYDGLNRLRYARLYQAGSQTATQEVRYDDAGNITYKTGVGSYEYSGPRPHAVTKAGNTSYHYDDNGNMSSDSGSRTLDYSVFDKPSLISKGGHDTRFSYGPDRSRFKRVDDNGKGTVTTLQIGSVEKVIERSTTGAFIKSFYRRNIAGVAIERIELNASDETAGTSTQYLHKDLQGSLDVITDSTGQVAKDAAGNKLVYSFDAWGKRRNALSWEQIAGAPANTVSALSVGAFNHLSSNRGYTGHEMLDEVGLIHMNGRVYDPTLARFVSADPLIDGITSVQGYNRYAYVHNNPLTYTDPSGYSSWNKYRDSVVKPVVAVAIAIWTGGQSLVALQGTNYAAAVGWAAAGGAAAGAVQSGTVKGAFFGAFSAVAFMGIGNAFQGATWATKGVVEKGVMGTGLNSYGYAAKVFAHSVTGGLLSAAQGGKFKHGFAAAGVTQAFAGGIDSIDAGNSGFSAARVVAAAVVGGTASAVSGGKFANGAITAAFSRAFNDENHPTAQKGQEGIWGRFKRKLTDYFIRPGETTAIGVGGDFVFGKWGIAFGAGYFKSDLDGNPLTVEEQGFYFYASEEVLGLDTGIQLEYMVSPNPNLFFGKSAEIGGSIFGLDGAIANGIPSSFLTSPADHIYGIGAGPGVGAHWAELDTQRVLTW
ncbi:RHS repeat-associated core domain-containing protein [Microbulbifer sp. SSSA007]|uniref:RHS repeat-associated core domain-containing protein n=1 Tax=Microbulbifer sp. SSSA007 TaxID=3243379 RepID=UPI004039060F